MAKLRFGSMELKPELPKLGLEQPNLGKQEEQAPAAPAFDMMDLVEKLQAMMPKSEAPAPIASMKMEYPTVDLLPLENAVSSQAARLMEHNERLLLLERAEKVVQAPALALPEVKQITHIKDVSPDVLRQCEALIEKVRMNRQLDLNGVKNQLARQKAINMVLSGAVILTILLHLL